MQLIATPGASNANVYAAASTADAYHAARPTAAAWDALQDDPKAAALLAATELLDTIKWAGSKGATTSNALTQSLAFPRQWVPTLEADADPEFVSEYFIDTSIAFYDSTVIPTPIVRATCELALIIAQGGGVDVFTADTKRVKQKTTGPLTTVYFDSQDFIRGLGRYPQVMRLIQHMFRDAGGVEAVRA
ncbi:MAG TPA: DnaT-like ssDNA-binding protein [Gemmatimonadaceae bacterium]|jgi:hypothetical protein